MQLPLQITFRNVDQSDAVEAKIRERAEKLETFFSPIISCRVAVETEHKHHQQGNRFRVRVEVKVPDRELVASREPAEHHAYTDVYVAIRDAFDAMKRQLEEYACQRRRHVKMHETPEHGRIAELHPEGDFGRIEMPDGQLVYFHRNSLLDGDFDKLAVGAQVRLNSEMGEEGPQAATVYLVGKHHIVG
jgi:ribosomal subunit interface protein